MPAGCSFPGVAQIAYISALVICRDGELIGHMAERPAWPQSLFAYQLQHAQQPVGCRGRFLSPENASHHMGPWVRNAHLSIKARRRYLVGLLGTGRLGHRRCVSASGHYRLHHAWMVGTVCLGAESSHKDLLLHSMLCRRASLHRRPCMRSRKLAATAYFGTGCLLP